MTWKEIDGYRGAYLISDTGIIYSRKSNKILSTNKKDRYERVVLYRYGMGRNHYVHRLVAKAFIKNDFNKPEVNHVDGNKMNNNVSNLEWVTKKDNAKHAYDNNLNDVPILKGENNGNSKLTRDQCEEIRRRFNERSSVLAKEFNVHRTTIQRIWSSSSWGCGPSLEIKNRGSRVYCSKINEKDVFDIKELLKTGMYQKDIAKKYNISQASVSLIKQGKNWKHA